MLTVAALTVLFCAAMLIFAGIKARESKLIFPNVRAYDIDFGGVSEAEAQKILESSRYGIYNARSIDVDFTGGGSISVSAAGAGLEQDCAETAHSLYLIGRHDSFVYGAIAYLRCLLGGVDEIPLPQPVPDEAYIRSEATKAAKRYDIAAVEDVIFNGEGELSWTRGTPGRRINVEKLTQLIVSAFINADFDAHTYSPETIYPADTDPEQLFELVHKEARDAYYDESYNVVDESFGITFDLQSARGMMAKAEYGQKVSIPLIVLKPAVYSAELKALLYRDLLASAVTPLTGNETRSKNIELAAGSVNGCIVLPDMVFSYNDTVGERTADKGYGEATAYSDGLVVQELGGGICQLSSTLYYCCLLADLNIVFRTGHIYYQTYVPYGMDATVSWGWPDFKFKNSTQYPIKIIARRDGSSLSVELWGTKLSDEYIKMDYHIDEHTPCGVSYKESTDIAPGTQSVADSGRDGMVVSTYRCRYSADGTLLEKKLEATSHYSPRDKVILIAAGN